MLELLMQVFPLGREVVPWPLSERFCSKSQGFPSPRLQNDGRRADFWGLGFSSPRLQNDGRRADFWRSEDSPPHVYRMLDEGQIVGVQRTPPPTFTECWRKGRLLGSRAGCRGSHHPTCRVHLGRGQARLRWQWASPSGLGGLWPCSENWSNLFASTGFFAGVGGGGVYLSGHLQQQFGSISEMSANKRE